jgi:hypothetical protein
MRETVCAASRPWVAMTTAKAVEVAARRFGDDDFAGVAGSLRRVCGLEGPSFGWDPNRVRKASAGPYCQRGRWVRAQSRREAQGSIGRASSGNAAGEQRTSGREIPEVEATSGERESFGDRAGQKRANYEREWSFGERASNGSVTVSTWSGGESSEGSCACGKCRMSAETSAVGTQPGEPQGR